MIDALNTAYANVDKLPRVRFEASINPDAYTWIWKKHQGGALHEPATIAAFAAIAEHRNVRVIYDCGALYGYFTLLAAILFPDAEVVAVDMHPSALSTLIANVSPCADVVHAAVSDETKAAKFWVSGFNIYEEPEGGWDNLDKIPGAMKPRGENNRGRGFVEVPFVKFDDIAKGIGKIPDLIKIDVEGYQAKAIRGAMETIRAHRPIVIIELHDPEKLARFGITNASTVQPLLDLGYSAYWCGEHRSKEARFEPVTHMNGAHEKLGIMVLVP